MRRGGVFTASRGFVACGKPWTSPDGLLLRLMSQLRPSPSKSNCQPERFLGTCPPPNSICRRVRTHTLQLGPVQTGPVKQNPFSRPKTRRTKNAAREVVERLPASADTLRDLFLNRCAPLAAARQQQPARRKKRAHRRSEPTQRPPRRAPSHGVHPRVSRRRLHVGSGRPQRRALHHLF